MSEKNTNAAVSSGRGVYMLIKAFKFILVSYVISLVLMALVAVLVVYTDVPESIMTVSVKVIMFLGAFLSALLTSRHAMSKGWLCGIFTSLLHVILLNLIAKLFFGADFFSPADGMKFMVSALCGFVGGTIGVNSSGR